METLETKFNDFILSRNSNESIDDLESNLFPKKKADYLVYSRSLVFEVKHLISDRGETINKKFSELAESDPDFPIFFGTIPAEELIQAHKRSDEFRKWSFDYAGRNIRDVLKSANTQIKDTQTALDIPRSTGVLVLLNDSVKLYDCDFVHNTVSRLLNKKRPDGSYEREHVEIVWFINEIDSSKNYTQSVLSVGPTLRNKSALTAFEMLNTQWSAFNGYVITAQ